MVGVSLCSKARRLSAARSSSTSAMRMSAGALQLHGEAGVEHVGARHALMDEARIRADEFGKWVRKAMTSCLVTRSISSMRATSKFAFVPFSQIALALSFGITPSSASASQACASISNQMLEPRLRLPDANHFGAGIARDHRKFPGE